MASPAKNRFRKKSSGPRVAALVVVLLIIGAVAGYFIRGPVRKPAPSPAAPASEQARPSLPAPLPPPPAAEPVPHPVPKPDADNHQKSYSGASARPEHDTEPYKAAPGTGRLAIIVDDMGSSMSEAKSLAAIGVPLTFSIIPGLRSYREVAMFAESRKIETMIHIPMQSKGWPERRLEANGLLVSMSDGELRERVAGFVREIPGAAGANNHMGSEFTEHADKMGSVLETLRQKNLFFVDSITSPQSVGLRLSRELGIKSGRRNVFLDNEQERGYILGQLGQAVRMARKNGAAFAICHPHPATIEALASALPGLAGKGIVLVNASQLVR